MFHKIANPRRTTLAHLDAATPWAPVRREPSAELPDQTANPRRTVLMKAPTPVGASS